MYSCNQYPLAKGPYLRVPGYLIPRCKAVINGSLDSTIYNTINIPWQRDCTSGYKASLYLSIYTAILNMFQIAEGPFFRVIGQLIPTRFIAVRNMSTRNTVPQGIRPAHSQLCTSVLNIDRCAHNTAPRSRL